MKKKQKCLNCLKPFEAKRSTAKFCSNACRVEYSRNQLTDGNEVKMASEVKPPAKPGWVESLEAFCNQQGITPQDLIDSYRSKKKPVHTEAAHPARSHSNFAANLRQQKCGIPPK